MAKLKTFAYRTVAVVHFTDQNWISKIIYCIRCEMVCKIGFTKWNTKIALVRASMVGRYYNKIFRTGADRHNSILMSLFLLVAETINKDKINPAKAVDKRSSMKKLVVKLKINTTNTSAVETNLVEVNKKSIPSLLTIIFIETWLNRHFNIMKSFFVLLWDK